jgi:hypothetical protein
MMTKQEVGFCSFICACTVWYMLYLNKPHEKCKKYIFIYIWSRNTWKELKKMHSD